MENFDDKINQILIAAALVSLLIGNIKEEFPEGMIDGSSIVVALLIIITVNSANNYSSERQLAEMLEKSTIQEV